MEQIREFFRNLWSKNYVRRLVFGFLALFAFGVIMDQLVMPLYTKHGEAIPLPDVTGKRFEDAKNILDTGGFQIVRDEERYDSQYPAGFVIEQIPRAGTKVKSGRRVHVIVSRGERRFRMPDLLGSSERDCELTLSKFGLRIGEKTYEYSTYYHEGTVSHQSIPKGVEVPMNTRVDLTISLGPVPDVFKVPAVEGRTLDDARDLIHRAGLEVGTIRYEVFEALLPETVVKQSLEAGTEVPQGTPINLVVSTLSGN